MIVVDTSAIMAMVLDEQDGPTFTKVLSEESTVLMSAGTLLELDVVALRRGGTRMHAAMQRILRSTGVIIVPVEGQSLRYARNGFSRFGQGRRSKPSALNFGDCFAYGLAKAEGAPLLFKGDDFSRTDVAVALTGKGTG